MMRSSIEVTIIFFLCINISMADKQRFSEDSHSSEEVRQKENVRIELHEDSMPPGNWTRFKLDHQGPMRVVVQSLQGDADIYVSYTYKYVNYELEKHNTSACSCGLDVIDIPESGVFSERPAYLGIYAHPGKPATNYRLMVVLAPNGTQSFDIDPDYINSVFEEKTGVLDGDLSFIFEILSFFVEILVTIL